MRKSMPRINTPVNDSLGAFLKHVAILIYLCLSLFPECSCPSATWLMKARRFHSNFFDFQGPRGAPFPLVQLSLNLRRIIFT